MLKKDDFKTILLTSIGGMLEFYDFVIFGMFAIVLGKTFFPPEGSPALQALSAFTVFAVGYFARPFGEYYLDILVIDMDVKNHLFLLYYLWV